MDMDKIRALDDLFKSPAVIANCIKVSLAMVGGGVPWSKDSALTFILIGCCMARKEGMDNLEILDIASKALDSAEGFLAFNAQQSN